MVGKWSARVGASLNDRLSPGPNSAQPVTMPPGTKVSSQKLSALETPKKSDPGVHSIVGPCDILNWVLLIPRLGTNMHPNGH